MKEHVERGTPKKRCTVGGKVRVSASSYGVREPPASLNIWFLPPDSPASYHVHPAPPLAQRPVFELRVWPPSVGIPRR